MFGGALLVYRAIFTFTVVARVHEQPVVTAAGGVEGGNHAADQGIGERAEPVVRSAGHESRVVVEGQVVVHEATDSGHHRMQARVLGQDPREIDAIERIALVVLARHIESWMIDKLLDFKRVFGPRLDESAADLRSSPPPQ